MNTLITHIALILIFLAGTATSYFPLAKSFQHAELNQSFDEREVLLFPDGQALQAVAFGYNNFLANILWFNTINYFGKHFKGDKDYKWLSHMCSVTMRLDPKANHIPEFCSLMLAWEADRPEQAISVLDLAINNDPHYWRYYYLHGVSSLLFMSDTSAAKEYFYRGSKVDGAPVFLKRLAAKTLANLEDPSTALNFLKSMVSRAKDPNEKAALQKHLNQTKHAIRIVELEKMVKAHLDSTKNKEVNLAEIIDNKQLLVDPYGGTYYWDQESQEVKSSSGVSRGKIISNNFSKMKKNHERH